MYELIVTIQHDGKLYQPAVLDGATLTRSFEGKPANFKFTLYNDEIINCTEGDRVTVLVDGTECFTGFIFEKNRDKQQLIKVTAYDQMRYLKNKDTYVFKNKKLSEIVSMICDDFGLKYGDLPDTGQVIPLKLNDNKTLIDIIYYYIYTTYTYTKKLYEIYDDNGKIMLANIEDMKLDYLLDFDVAEDYQYKSSIDKDTYNRIKLISNKKEEGSQRKMYVAKDEEAYRQWGVLQYFDKIDEKIDGQKKANELLKIKNRKTRTLTVKNAIGDIRVRGGSSIICKMDLGDIALSNYMVVKKAVHHFSNKEHFMDLDLMGRDIDV